MLATLNQCDQNHKLLRLKIIRRRLEECWQITKEISDFQIIEWGRLLEDHNLEVQINTLDIINKSIETFIKLKSFEDIMKSLVRNVQHPNDLYRNCLYDTALLVYGYGNETYAQAAKDILIVGLTDQAEDNRNKVINIWKEKMHLPHYIAERFTYILSELYVSKAEDHFLGFANYYLISLISDGDKFDDLLFEHPLEDCNFEDYQLQTNWRLQHPSVVPLFAETFQSFDSDMSVSRDVFQLRQTQVSLEFAPTQNSQDQQLKSFTSLDSSLAAGLVDDGGFKNPNAMNLSQKYRQRRRFLDDKAKISKQFAHFETKKKIVKTQKRFELAKEREKKVAIYRSYRKGDFPDVQIALSAVLTPLQMLALVSPFSKL